MHNNKKLLILLTSLVLLVAVGVGVFFIASTDTSTIKGQMQGYVISADGEVLQTIHFTLDARLTEPVIGEAKLKLSISNFPEGLDYSLLDDYDYYEPIPTNTPKTYFSFSVYYADLGTSAVVSDQGAVNMEIGTLILRIKDHDCYIVASRDPNADPQALLESFALFREHYPLG